MLIRVLDWEKIEPRLRQEPPAYIRRYRQYIEEETDTAALRAYHRGVLTRDELERLLRMRFRLDAMCADWLENGD